MKIALQIQVTVNSFFLFNASHIQLFGRGLNISLIDEHGHTERLQHANVKV